MHYLLLALALGSPPLMAGDFFVSASPDANPSGPDVGGLNWVRVFNNLEDGGWWLTHHWEYESMPGYNVAPMTDELVVDMGSRIRLAEYEEIKDHGIERCPDGSFLHVYSLSVTNNSARAARYTSDWEITAEGWVEEDEPARAHNDMPVICSEHLQGVAFTNHMGLSPTLFEIGPDATVIATHELDIHEHISGGAFKYDAESDKFLMITNGEPGLKAHWIRRDLSIDRVVPFEPIPSLSRHFWPQGLMRAGDYWLLVFLGEETGGQYLAGDGDVYVAVLNDDFETMETIKVSDNVTGELGSARPSFARHGDQLMVAWDKGFMPHVSVVTLDLGRLGIDGEDSGFSSSAGGDDTDTGSPCAGGDDDDSWGDGSSSDGTADDDGGSTTDEVDGEYGSGGMTGNGTILTGDTADDWEEGGADEGIDEDPCEKGCGCSHSPQSPQAAWWTLLLALVGVRRRR
jgi:MYXO-CTERM domain-containing protein